jgi:kanamycin kinase
VRAVWINELDGVTFAFGATYAKWAPAGSAVDLDQEAVRLRWAAPFTPVPHVVEVGHDDEGSWIVTAALQGENACSTKWLVQPARAVHALGEGLRALHDLVCHGDACVPNTLLRDDGSWLAHVDLGSLGVADRWADLAVATWSTEWNFGPGWDRELLAAYGVAADPDRTAYYRLLWDLGP